MLGVILCSRNHWAQIPAQARPRTSQNIYKYTPCPTSLVSLQTKRDFGRVSFFPPTLTLLTQLLFQPVCDMVEMVQEQLFHPFSLGFRVVSTARVSHVLCY